MLNLDSDNTLINPTKGDPLQCSAECYAMQYTTTLAVTHNATSRHATNPSRAAFSRQKEKTHRRTRDATPVYICGDGHFTNETTASLVSGDGG